jgi:hypothetical protein
MDRIEFEEPTHSVCDCCGKTTTRLTRFVTRDGSAYAVYYAAYTADHEDGQASVMVGIGDWSRDDVEPEEVRCAFTFRLWLAEDSFQVSIIDPDDSVWNSTFLGRRIPRAEALLHPLIQEVFALSDHMVLCDEPLIAFLNGCGDGRGAEARTFAP